MVGRHSQPSSSISQLTSPLESIFCCFRRTRRDNSNQDSDATLLPILNHYQAVSDVPIPAIYDRLAIKFPQAKFLFLYRNPFDWVPSVRWNQRNNREFRPYVRAVYWKYFEWCPPAIADLSDVQLLWMYSRHMSDVIAYFQETGPDRLGIFDLDAPDNTEKISSFVGMEPRVQFPHVGQRPRGDQL